MELLDELEMLAEEEMESNMLDMPAATKTELPNVPQAAPQRDEMEDELAKLAAEMAS